MFYTLRDSLRNDVIIPNLIYDKLKIICDHMIKGEQQDAYEFLIFLIQSLKKSYLNTIPASKKLESEETNPFSQIFGGLIRQEITCLRCKFVSITFQPLKDILVEIKQSYTLEDALANVFKKKLLL